MTDHQAAQVSSDPAGGDVGQDIDRLPIDLPRWLTWFVLPALGLSVILLLVLELVLGPEAMQSGFYIQDSGQTMTWYELMTFKEGPVEYIAVLVLLPGIAASVYALFRRKRFPGNKLGIWMLICALGLTYFAGEELSWGHHIAVSLFGKEAQSETTSALGLNEQGETNIHNLDNFAGKMLGRNSKNIVELWCYIGALAVPLILARRRPLTPSEMGYWFWPTTATVVCAVMVFLTYRPVRLYIKLFPFESEPNWARQSELQEFFMAATLVIYVSSIAWRLKQVPDPVNTVT